MGGIGRGGIIPTIRGFQVSLEINNFPNHAITVRSIISVQAKTL